MGLGCWLLPSTRTCQEALCFNTDRSTGELRGGMDASWCINPGGCRATVRSGHYHGERHEYIGKGCLGVYGFRVVVPVSKAP